MATKKKKTWQELLAEFQNDDKNYTEPSSKKFYQGWLKGGAFRDGYQVGDLLKTYAGTYQDVHKNAFTAVLDATENLIDVGAIGVGTVGGLFSKDFQKQTDQFVAKDLLQSRNTANWIVNHLPYDPTFFNYWSQLLTGDNYEDDSLLGDKADSMLQSLAHQAGAMGLQAAGVPWQIPTAVNSFVPEYENAINQGATHGEALLSGAVSAGAEVGSEMLFKGSGMLDEVGLISLDNITSGIKNKAIKALADYGIDIAAEGTEEIISQFAGSLGSLIYEADDPSEILDILADKNSFDNVMTAFISGGIMSGFGNAGNVVNSVRTGTDYRTGLTAMEQSVYDAALEQNLKDYKAENGKKATGKAKDKIAAATTEQLQKGYISTDTIGKTLASDAYGQYQQVNEQISKLQPEYDQLYNMKTGEKTDAQSDRQRELKQQLDDLKQQRQELDSRIEAVAKGTQLEESYRERSRRAQAFQASATQYDNEYARQTVQNIVDSGVVNNTNKSHEFVDFLANVSAHIGQSFTATDAKRLKDTGYAIEDATVNGYYAGNGITININSPRALNAVVGHEVTHAMKGSQMFDALSSAAVAYAKANGSYNSRLAALRRIYKGKPGYETDFDTKLQEELVADIIGDHLFTDEDFVRQLAMEDRNLFQKIFDEVKHLVKMATPGSKEARQLEKLKHTFEKVWNETKNTAQQPDGVKYSLGKYSDAQKSNWSNSKKIIVYNNDAQLLGFIDASISNKDSSQKMYFGVITGDLAGRIKTETGLDFEGKNAVLRANNVRKILLHDHGDAQKESLRGQIAVTKTDFLAIPDIFGNPDTIKSEPQGYKGKPAATFEKNIGQKKYTMFVVDSGGSLDIFVQTMYIHKEKGSIANVANAKALTSTPETPVGTAPTDKIQQNGLNVNSKMSLSEDAGGAASIGRNVYGADVALDPVEQDVQVEDNSNTETSLPADSSAEVDTAQLERILGSKDNFISQNAAALYEELRNLKKGVRASGQLSYLLDHFSKDEWGSIRTALLNIRDNPSETVNPNSRAESIARELLGREYDDSLEELTQMQIAANNPGKIQTVKERVLIKLQNLEKELSKKQLLQEWAKAEYDNEIAKLKARYAGLSNKATPKAMSLLDEIVEVERRQADKAADYEKSISDLNERIAKAKEGMRTGEDPTEQRAMRTELHESIINQIQSDFAISGYDFSEVLKNAKNLSTFTTVDSSPQRVMEKALGTKPGRILADYTVNQIAQNETAGIRWLNSYTDKKAGVLAKLSEKYEIKPGSKESAAAQMYAEGFWVDESKNIVPYGDAELNIDFPDITVRNNIKGLARDPIIRQIYDETLADINASRSRNAYPEIQKLDNYFLHFQAMTDTFSELGIPFNPKDIKAKDLPADLNGVTADLKPGQPYFSSAMHRKGKRTSFDLLGGLENYLHSAKNQIFHIDDIQKLRALRNYIAETYGQMAMEKLDFVADDDIEAKMDKIKNSHLSTFARFLHEEANVLAGKTALIDRGVEGILGRKGLTFLNTLNKQVGSNFVGYNLSSSMTNLLAVVQGAAKMNKKAFVKGFFDFSANRVKSLFGNSDTFADESSVVIRRKGESKFHRTPWEKVSDPGYVLMGAIDNVSTEILARAKFYEFEQKGMDAEQAHYETDKWVSRLMGDRSLGQQPLLFNSKIANLIVKFQLEVRNQLDSMFYDTIQDAKLSAEEIDNKLKRNANIAAKVTSTWVQLAIGQYLFGQAFETVAGYNPAFDIVSVLIKAFGFDDDEKSEDTILDNLEQGFLELLGDLPYSSVFTSGGRIPISSSLPIRQFINGTDQYGNEKNRLRTLAEAAPYYVLPGGYSQAKKTVQGLSMFLGDKPVTGSYTASGDLRYEVEPTPGNILQAGLFGQWANKNAQEYIDQGRKPLSEKQTEEFVELDIPIQQYWDIRDHLNRIDRSDSKTKTAEKIDYINSLGLSIEQQNVLVNNLLDRKEPVDMTDYDKFGSWAEFDFYIKNPEKHAFLKDNDIPYRLYSYDKDAYNWAFENQSKYAVSKAFLVPYTQYYAYRQNINAIQSLKDSSGKTVSGSQKHLRIKYINSLPLTNLEKALLIKQYYPSETGNDQFIADYLNMAYGLTASERYRILYELGLQDLWKGGS